MKRRGNAAGFTLLELTFAIAILALVLAATVQTLVAHYQSTEFQKQRVAAIESCKAVLSDMRHEREASPGAFPAALFERWPDNQSVPGAGSMAGEVITVSYNSPNANPLVVTVRSDWTTVGNRSVSATVMTALTDG